ncbi:MAG: hypothetical protein AB7J73_08790 [Gammaproteobacteria bacterium]
MLILLALAGAFGAGAVADDRPPKIIGTDAFLVLLEAKMREACDEPGSPFACMSKDLKHCRAALELTIPACVEELRNTLPAEIDLANNGEAKQIFVRCTMDKYLPALGPENINVNGCKKAKR